MDLCAFLATLHFVFCCVIVQCYCVLVLWTINLLSLSLRGYRPETGMVCHSGTLLAGSKPIAPVLFYATMADF